MEEQHPDWDWDYWEAQMEGYQKAFKKPIWRDFLETQRIMMDKVHEFFWVGEPEPAPIASGEGLKVALASEVS